MSPNSAKSDNLRLSYDDLTISNFGSVRHLGFDPRPHGISTFARPSRTQMHQHIKF